MRFAGRAALITGAARGVGMATAEVLARDGAGLALNDVNAAALEATAKALRLYGGRVTTHAGSVTDPAFVATMVAEATEAHGQVDLLANNAGGGPPGVPWAEFADSKMADFRALFELNFFSQAMMLHALLPGMLERGYGRIVCGIM